MKAELYANTGFNAVNVPDSITTLRSLFTPVKTYDNINLNQSIWQPELRVSGLDPKVARTIDYVVIQGDPILEESAYTVDHFSFVAPGTCSFYLYIDAYNTMGGLGATSGNLILSGTAKRMHVTVADDTSQFFTLPEPFENAQRETVTITDLAKISGVTTGFIAVSSLPPAYVEPLVQKGSQATVLDATVQLATPSDVVRSPETMGQQQQWVTTKYAVEGTDVTTYQAIIDSKIKLRSVGGIGADVKSTSVYVKYGDEGTTSKDDAKIFNLDLTYDMENQVELLAEIVNYGMEKSIIGIWEVPDEFLNIAAGSANSYSAVKGTEAMGYDKLENKQITGSVPVNITSYNNKVKYGQSASATILSLATGSSITKEIYEVTSSTPGSAASIGYFVGANVNVGGAPFALFTYKNGTKKNLAFDVVTGKSWKNLVVSVNGYSGRNVAALEAGIQGISKLDQISNIAYGNLISGAINGLIGNANRQNVNNMNAGQNWLANQGDANIIATNWLNNQSAINTSSLLNYIGNASNTVINSTVAMVNTKRQYDAQMEILGTRSRLATSNVSSGNSDTLRELTGNEFIMVIAQYSPEDLTNFDTFLTRFGYNVGNRRITNADFYSRPAYNFVQINDMTIQSVTGNEALIDLAKSQLKIGLRIWHKAPNAADMEASGNR